MYPALTITMSRTWSEKFFKFTDEKIEGAAIEAISQTIGEIEITNVEIKKWRYCEPLQTWSSLFEALSPNLFLAGDAFGGASLNGALRSSQALFDHLAMKSN